MEKMKISVAYESDIPFIVEIYNANIDALHGIYRTCEEFKKMISDDNSIYYIVKNDVCIAWFRVDFAEDMLWLGML